MTKLIRFALISGALALSFASIVVGEAIAGAYEDGVAAFYSGDFATALKDFLDGAQTGDARAQDYLGRMYESGNGVTQDYKEAVKWYRLAAAQGYAHAQSDLGWMYAKGNGVTQDYVRAYMWFSLALARGDTFAAKGQQYAATKLAPAQVAQAKTMARDCKASHFKNCGGV